MAYNEQELLPIDQIKRELYSLCADGQSGELCLFTEQKHTAVISIHEGEITGLRYRISRGNDALKLIKAINKARISFKKSGSNTKQTNTTYIPSTMDIFNFLEIKPNGNTVGDKNTVQQAAKKILVVEDSRTQRRAICRMLDQNGYHVVEASDGYEALAQLSKTKPDLILLDIVMPGIDGYKLMSLIKEKQGMENVPIIMLTSRDSLIDKMRGKVSNTDEYLTKPFIYEELIAKVDKYLYIDDDYSLLKAQLQTY